MPATTVPSVTDVRRIVELAGRAPSIHNSQPWRWRSHGDVLELAADRSRQLRATDPDGRTLVLSCGAALHHAQVAARALGWGADVERQVRPASSVLARLHLCPQPVPADAERVLADIAERCTDRRGFTSWPVPEGRLVHLGEVAEEWGVRAYPLLDDQDRFRVERLVRRARRLQEQDMRMHAEQQRWVARAGTDAIAPALLDASDATAYPDRYGAGLVDETDGRDVVGSDGLVVLGGPDDDATAWLRAGEALSALWLQATDDGLSVVPLSQVIEVPQTRQALSHEVLGGAHPLILVRVGWQPVSRPELPRTPRRPVGELLHAEPA